MTYQTILYETKGPIGILTLNRPERLNAINQEMVGEVFDLFDRIEADENVRAIVVTGAGRAFSSRDACHPPSGA